MRLNVKSYNKHINIQDCKQCLFSSYTLNVAVNKCVGNILCCLIAIQCFCLPGEVHTCEVLVLYTVVSLGFLVEV